jgi:hypothetical protein
LQSSDNGPNTAVGAAALAGSTHGYNNIALGYNAGINVVTGHDNIWIGDAGGDVLNTIAIGANPPMGAGPYTQCFIAGIYGAQTFGDGLPVYSFPAGQLSTLSSSRTFKDDIKPMGQASEAVLALKPVTFHYKKDTTCTPQFGLVAEEVEKVNPDLIVRDKEGKTYSVRYDAVNVMLLNEFLKEHRKVDSLEKAMAEQQKENAAMRAMLKEQAAQIQKVSAQLELSKPAPQAVATNP